MKITIEPPLDLQISDIKVSLEIPPDMLLALFFGHLVMNGTVPEEIRKAMDETPKDSFPKDWEMVVSMWRNRNVDMDVKEIYEIITPWLKDAL